MKHENATSADNAKIAATTRHTLTFEEVYAMTYVRESIECLLDQNLRQYPVLNGYKDDLRQEILIRLNNELPVFDPEKSSFFPVPVGDTTNSCIYYTRFPDEWQAPEP